MDFFGEALDKNNFDQLKACATRSNICIVTENGIVQGHTVEAIQSVKMPSTAGLVQLQDGKKSVCLAGLYSGGSAAAWMFDGWQINKKVMELKRISNTTFNSDYVPPKDLAKVMLNAYKKQSSR
ncbi:MAG: hypothetical protein ACXU8A_09555 [Burkholderiaceae bacterium]